MQILIQYSSARAYFDEANAVLWKKSMRKTLLFIYYFPIAIFFFLIMAVSDISGIVGDKDDHDTCSGNLLLLIPGFFIFFIYVLSLIRFVIVKEKFFSKHNSLIKSLRNDHEGLRISIDEEKIQLDSTLFKSAFSYKLIDRYQLHQHYLILYSSSGSIFIDRNKIQPDQFQFIISVLSHWHIPHAEK